MLTEACRSVFMQFGPLDRHVTRIANTTAAQHRLLEAGQRPAALGRAAAPALGGQQLGNEPGQFPGDVKRGTIGDHVEPFSGR